MPAVLIVMPPEPLNVPSICMPAFGVNAKVEPASVAPELTISNPANEVAAPRVVVPDEMIKILKLEKFEDNVLVPVKLTDPVDGVKEPKLATVKPAQTKLDVEVMVRLPAPLLATPKMIFPVAVKVPVPLKVSVPAFVLVDEPRVMLLQLAAPERFAKSTVNVVILAGPATTISSLLLGLPPVPEPVVMLLHDEFDETVIVFAWAF